MKSIDERRAQRREIDNMTAQQKAPDYQAQGEGVVRGKTPPPEVVLPKSGAGEDTASAGADTSQGGKPADWSPDA